MAENSGVNEGPVVLAFDVGDGKVVSDFGSFSDEARSVALQPDGKIIVGGSVVARYNGDGTLDTSFGEGGRAVFDATGLALQPDGKILAAGTNGNALQLVRLNPNGTPDTSLDGDGSVITPLGTLATGRAVALQPDGKILVAGTSSIGANADFGLVRYNPDGSLDTTFDTDGVVTTDFGGTRGRGFRRRASARRQDHRRGYERTRVRQLQFCRCALQHRWQPRYDFRQRRQAHGRWWRARTAREWASLCNPTGRSFSRGQAPPPAGGSDFSVLRFDPAGNPDATFDSDGRVTVDFGFRVDFGSGRDIARDVALQPDGRIVVAGSASGGTFSQPLGFFALARLNSDGTLDTSFDADGKVSTSFGGPFDSAEALAVQPDGRIVAAGSTIQAFTDSDIALARYDANGQLDPTFHRVDDGLYSENGAAMFFGASLADADSARLASATVSIIGNFRPGEDLLSFTNDASTMGNIRGVYSPDSGVLTLSSRGRDREPDGVEPCTARRELHQCRGRAERRAPHLRAGRERRRLEQQCGDAHVEHRCRE